MTPRPLVAVLVAGAVLSASIGAARAQSADPDNAPAPAAAAPPPSPAQYPPPGYPQYPQTIYVPEVALGPRYIKDWEEGQPVPYGYHPEKRARKGMVISGAVVFGVLYLLSTLIATDNNNSNDYSTMWIPVAGPFMQIGQNNNDSVEDRFLILDGVAQAAGLTVLILGLAFPRSILVRNDLGVTVSFAPSPIVVGRDGGGLGLVGRF